MDYNFLFYDKLPPGVKTIFVNGKRISREDFIRNQKKYFNKDESKNPN